MRTKIMLIRHGQTEWNQKKMWMGKTDIDLDDVGVRQGEALKEKLSGLSFDRIYVSPRKRAIRFSRIIFGGAEVELVDDLREINFGIFEGLTHDDAMEKHKDIYDSWLKDPFKVSIPGGEDLLDFRTRVVRAFRHIAFFNKNKTVAVVTHGGPISMIINDVTGAADFWGAIPENGSVTVMTFERGKGWARSSLC